MTQAGYWIDWRVWKRLSGPRTFNNRWWPLAVSILGKCLLTHEVVLWVVLTMGLFTDLPIRQVFEHARRLRKGEQSPDRSSLCVARQRLGVAPVRQLFAQIARPLAQPTTPGAFYGGFRLMGIDSTVYDVPDTPANDTAFGRPSAGPSRR